MAEFNPHNTEQAAAGVWHDAGEVFPLPETEAIVETIDGERYFGRFTFDQEAFDRAPYERDEETGRDIDPEPAGFICWVVDETGEEYEIEEIERYFILPD